MTAEATIVDTSASAFWASGGVFRRTVIPWIGWSIPVLVIGFLVLWPLFQLELRAFSDGGGAFYRMFTMPRFFEILRTTVYLAAFSSVLAVILGTGLAWCATVLPPSVRGIGQFVPLLPLLLPGVVAVTGWMFLLSPTIGYLNQLLRMLPFLAGTTEGPFDAYTVPWIIIITALLLTSFVYLFVHTGLQSMGQELEVAAATCGASPLRRFFTITLPLLRPAIFFGGSIVFLLGMGQFTAPLILGRTEGIDVLTTAMYYLTQRYPIDYGLGAALGFPILLVGIAFVVFQRYVLAEQRRYVVVSARSRYQSSDTKWWAAVVVAAYGLVTTVLPLLALIYVSLSPFWRSNITYQGLTLRHYRTVLQKPDLLGAIWTSVEASVVAVFILLIIGFVCAIALLESTRIPRPLRVAIDFLVTLPIAIPASLMGFGLLYAYTGPPIPLYGTAAVLMVTYVTLMIGYTSRLQFTTLVAMGREFNEASRACGAGPLRTMFFIILPLARRGMAAAATLTFVLLFHEFSASMMVRSARTQVIGSVLYEALIGGIYPQVAVLALIMVVVTIIGVAVASWAGGSSALEHI
jgi:iron(III) transport system permease protein